MPVSHRAGEFIAFSEGEYSDYSFNGLYRVVKDLDLAQAVDEMLPHLKTEALLKGKTIPDYVDQDNADEVLRFLQDYGEARSSALGAYLMRRGFVEPIDYDEVHLGSYGRMDVEAVKTRARVRAQNLADQV